jgi:hypothetical protein
MGDDQFRTAAQRGNLSVAAPAQDPMRVDDLVQKSLLRALEQASVSLGDAMMHIN